MAFSSRKGKTISKTVKTDNTVVSVSQFSEEHPLNIGKVFRSWWTHRKYVVVIVFTGSALHYFFT